MKIEIIHQDEQVLVIDKPAGVVVNRADSVKVSTIQDWVDESFDYELSHDEENRNGIVHRLDKDTSGVMVLAKTKEAMVELQRQFHDRETEKTYLALLHGKLTPSEGFLTVPMGRSSYDRQSFTVDLDGKISKTSYKVVKHFDRLEKLPDGVGEKDAKKAYQQGFTLVEAYPKTGRTHQIRVAFKHLNHPLVGDVKYVGKRRAKLDIFWCERQFLHAHVLGFTNPKSGERVEYKSELPEDLEEVLGNLS